MTGTRHLARLACAPAAVAVAALGLAGGAHADGDPASDVLIASDVFVSTVPPADVPGGRALEQLAAAARKEGLPLKVAIVSTPTDLGSVASLFGRPQTYARFLGAELTFVFRGTLVVVMPSGYGIVGPGATDAARKALALVPPARSADLGTLAGSAATAVVRVAAADGHRLAVPAAAERKSKSGTSPTYYIGIGIAVLAAAVGGWFAYDVRRERRRS